MTTPRAIMFGALIVALAIVAAGFLCQPRYSMTNVGNGFGLRLDRRTGQVVICSNAGCGPAGEGLSNIPPGYSLVTPNSSAGSDDLPPGYVLDNQQALTNRH